VKERIPEALRQQVRERADKRCEYCRKREGVMYRRFHTDHIRPKQHGGMTIVDNLAWACFECNVSKGRDVSSYDRLTGNLTTLYNPRTQLWDDHFVIDHGEIRGTTAIGRVTVELLNFNEAEEIAIRQNMIRTKRW